MKKFMSMLLLLAVTASLALFSCSCADNGEKMEGSNGKLNIITTIFPPYDFARAVAGDKANLTMLIKPGASVHSFEPSPEDIIKIKNADVFIYIGGTSEDWVERILQSMDMSGIKILRLMDYVNIVEEEIVEGMEPEKESEPGDDSDMEYDEHIWTSPKNAIKLINAVSDSICELDTPNIEFYRKNAQNYIEDIEKVDEEIALIVKNSSLKRIVVADKFPFSYFAKEYGINYKAAFPACSDQTDASAATIAYLIDTVKKDNIPYVYYVELSNRNVANIISEQTGAGMLLLNSAHNLTAEDFKSGATYLSFMRQNAENLRMGMK